MTHLDNINKYYANIMPLQDLVDHLDLNREIYSEEWQARYNFEWINLDASLSMQKELLGNDRQVIREILTEITKLLEPIQPTNCYTISLSENEQFMSELFNDTFSFKFLTEQQMFSVFSGDSNYFSKTRQIKQIKHYFKQDKLINMGEDANFQQILYQIKQGTYLIEVFNLTNPTLYRENLTNHIGVFFHQVSS